MSATATTTAQLRNADYGAAKSGDLVHIIRKATFHWAWEEKTCPRLSATWRCGRQSARAIVIREVPRPLKRCLDCHLPQRMAIRHRAIADVAKAVATGRLAKLPCEICGASKVQAHHKDYSRSLDVMWLCPKHHRQWHRLYNAVGLPTEVAS